MLPTLFSWVDISLNLVLMVLPMAFIPLIATTEIKLAMRAYSMAVAPFEFFNNLINIIFSPTNIQFIVFIKHLFGY